MSLDSFKNLLGSCLFSLAFTAWAQVPTPEVAPPGSAEETQAPVESERFDIEAYEVEGNTLLKPQEIEHMLLPYTGRQREYGDVQRALEVLERTYRARGYSAVQVFVPEQELGGKVKIQVVESSIRRIRVEGARFVDDVNVRRALPSLQEGAYPNATAISENVQLANENPARIVDVVLKGAEEEGIVDVDINVTDSDPHRFSLTLDNTGNNATGQHRLGLGYQHANLWNRDHVLSLNYITSVEKSDQVSIYSMSYRLPLYGLGDSMDFIVAKSDVDAGTSPTVAGPLAFSGRGDVYGVRYNWLLPRSGEYSHRVIFGLDLKAFRNTCTIGGVAVIGGAPACGPAGVDVGIRPWSVAYSGLWSRPGEQTDFSVSYSRNWAGTSAGSQANITAARPSPVGAGGAPANYKVLRISGSHTVALAGDWQVRAAASAQYTRDPLISGEQFGIAGSTAVRGFSEREVARDTGFFGNLELYSPNLGSALGRDGSSIRVLGFYDAGYATNNPLEGELKQKSAIAAFGLGLRWTEQKNMSIRWDFGQVLDEGGSKQRGARRSQFSTYFAF